MRHWLDYMHNLKNIYPPYFTDVVANSPFDPDAKAVVG